MTHHIKRNGFTLIELLIVIAIIGILTGLLFTNFTSARERSRDTKRKSDLNSLKQSLQLYSNDFNTFPAAGSGGTIAGCGATGTSVCSWTSGGTAGSAFSAGNPATVYMGSLPGDPLSPTQQYSYAASATVDYTISATLENASDPDSALSQSRCGVSTPVAKVYMVCNQ
jgi:prepilin-type N-terminal cleavage/methylation domain-containing protein